MSSAKYDYSCTVCGKRPAENRYVSRELLVAKKVSFQGVGFKGRTIRSRVVAWMCPECLEQDPDWHLNEKSHHPRREIHRQIDMAVNGQ